MLRLMQECYEDSLWLLRYACNGMLLLQYFKSGKFTNVTIYNPITHARKDLPPTPKYCANWALVHDASTRKYKVFGIESTMKSFVFRQGETDWIYLHKLATTAEREEVTVSKIICLENKLHWIASWFSGFENAEIVHYIYSLDVADDEEHIKRTVIPFKVQYQHYLSEVTGSLYITNVFHTSLETWVLKDMGKNLWSKCCSISYGSRIPFHSFVPPIDLEDSTKFLDQSKIIKSENGYLSIYDLKGTRKIALKRSKSGVTGRYSPHINSLVSWN
ncbi:hypothetical protein FRX31_028895 [Thalictrum thalictroides]|uniref:F-box associated beta-propeller type 3 domain-containing protein n=1 Tax=Thalictrum thalictroides TaxID=46969 RepID=A0A7J6VA28_THATH|nr:hypothetical protein FRX31_028895 [Thalictrum thalictroides]